MKLSKYILVVLTVFCSLKSNSQILKGGDMFVKNIFGNTQQVTARIVIDWPIIINKPYIRINWGDGSPPDSLIYRGSNCTNNNASTLTTKPNPRSA